MFNLFLYLISPSYIVAEPTAHPPTHFYTTTVSKAAVK